MIRETAGESALEQATRRLERAVALLEQRLVQKAPPPGADTGDLFQQDRSRLAAELDRARARERDLEAAGAEASAALGRAIDEIRSALDGAAAQAQAEA